MRIFLCLSLLICCVNTVCLAQDLDNKDVYDICYTTASDDYSRERCRLDMHVPKGKRDFVTVIWFHGGGLTAGQKDIPAELKDKGVAIVSASYRFSPRVSVDDIIRDAAQAIKWTYDNIEEYGGNRNKIVIAGYSAGAYLALMLGLNKTYLDVHGINVDRFLGLIAVSGQTITHFTARKSMGMKESQPLIDSLAPLYWVRKDALPITLITGDRELEIMGRYEENAYFKRMLQLVGHQHVQLYELEGYDHGVTLPAYPLLLRQVVQWARP